MQALIDVILPVFLVIGAGYLTVWKGLFPQEGVDGLMRFSQGLAIPCLLFQAIASIDLAASFEPALLTAFYTSATVCFVLGVIGARVFFGRDPEDAIAIGFCCLFSNSVLLGLPITERAYGPEALAANFAIIAFHAPFCYLLGITTMEITRARGERLGDALRKVLRAITHNGLFIGIALGLAWNLGGLAMPTAIEAALDLVVSAALPVALFALGGVLYQYRPEGDFRTIAMVCAISLLLHPLLAFGMGKVLSLSEGHMRSGVLTAAMAPGFNAYIFANMYGRAKRVAASSVLVATGLTVITAWLWLSLLG